MAEQDSDRSEQATPHKLEEARKKGSVARSMDFTALGIMAALVLVVYANGSAAMTALVRIQQRVLAQAGRRNWEADVIMSWLGGLLVEMLSILGPLFLTLMIAAVLVNLMQTGPIISFHPLIPDMQRLNPVAGMKRIFSIRTLFEAGKSILKLLILGTVVYFTLRGMIPGLVGLPQIDPKGYARVMLDLTASLLSKIVLTLLAIALLDFGFTRWEFAKRMRMSKRDIKDETKNREGDPRIRSRIRELRKEMLKRSRSLAKAGSADVLITNPTRLAVALSYRHGESGAPQVVAKGAGELARKMRELAARKGIPVVQNRALARTLFREVDYDAYVPEKLYPQIAKIMIWVYSMRAARRDQGKVA
ncbi:flagellar biosynthesis protein FlhB [Massilia sp. BJB1822]|uniref:EscU/YscU/HrcU family type III secretion system export apparatus switch protein n=1 Tax=Massilia sp. BJB1822 TaxID=2744470 RepID=UPI0015946D10|nr:EscU/YscU/HrcU family type III secretion system export apparatus switch protein [Massilia sp. BJB1822]NVE01844.1 EscU/YscU/HrcU family type III secretion system export apparatus switch protein [Massilia sp. BJB1822]